MERSFLEIATSDPRVGSRVTDDIDIQDAVLVHGIPPSEMAGSSTRPREAGASSLIGARRADRIAIDRWTNEGGATR